MNRTLLLATNNSHKVIEMRALLGDIPFTLVAPRDRGIALEVDEPYFTYAENARQKALAFATASGLLALADDSGLEIDALARCARRAFRPLRRAGDALPRPLRVDRGASGRHSPR